MQPQKKITPSPEPRGKDSPGGLSFHKLKPFKLL